MAYYGPVTQGPPIASPSLPAMGRGGDTVMGHLTPGEVVIPTAAQSPPLMQMVNASMQQQGMDPRQYTVGPPATWVALAAEVTAMGETLTAPHATRLPGT